MLNCFFFIINLQKKQKQQLCQYYHRHKICTIFANYIFKRSILYRFPCQSQLSWRNSMSTVGMVVYCDSASLVVYGYQWVVNHHWQLCSLLEPRQTVFSFFFQFLYFKDKKAINLLKFLLKNIIQINYDNFQWNFHPYIYSNGPRSKSIHLSCCSYRELHLYYPHGLILCSPTSYFEMAYIGLDRRYNTADSRNM